MLKTAGNRIHRSMDEARKENVMSVEVAIQRELAYRKKIASLRSHSDCSMEDLKPLQVRFCLFFHMMSLNFGLMIPLAAMLCGTRFLFSNIIAMSTQSLFKWHVQTCLTIFGQIKRNNRCIISFAWKMLKAGR